MIAISLSKLPHQNREELTGSILFRKGFVCLGGGRHPYMYSPRVFAWLGADFSIGQPQPRETLGGGMREVGHTTLQQCNLIGYDSTLCLRKHVAVHLCFVNRWESEV